MAGEHRRVGCTGVGIALTILLRGVTLAPVAEAAPPTTAKPQSAGLQSANQQAALKLFERSAESYRAGRFEEAAAQLREAYRLSPVPILLYNLGRAQEGMGDLPGAIESYRAYLRSDAKIADRPSIEKRIATLERQEEERKKLLEQKQAAEVARRDAEARLTTPVSAPPTRARIAAPWIVLSLGVATLATGGGLIGAARARHDDATRDPVGESALEKQRSADQLALGATLSFGVGGAIAGIGLVWGIVDAVRFRRHGTRHAAASYSSKQ